MGCLGVALFVLVALLVLGVVSWTELVDVVRAVDR